MELNSLKFGHVYAAEEVPDLDPNAAPHYRTPPWPLRWGTLRFEIRNHVRGWMSVVRGRSSADCGHPVLRSGGWVAMPRDHDATAVLHGYLHDAEIAAGRAVAGTLTATACTRKGWDDNNRVVVAEEAQGNGRWAAAWLHNGQPGFAEYDSWERAHTEAARQLEIMATGSTCTGDTYTAAIASAHLRRCAHQVRGMVLTADLGDTVRLRRSEMQHDRTVTQVAAGLGVERTFLYRVFKGTEWTR
ncbi:hypothetical protein [Streptomyces rhizosphaericus]|uniref:hypothetical protein n=1 Tax=Streptomyces rhizosphaericus TaxID=114699 RepID=UPI0011810CE1|nr:hypothetical protein [Streptomyces rhizosphaericus]